MSQRLTTQQKQEIITLYQSGKTPTEIGNMFSVYPNSITRLLKKEGIERNQHAKKLLPEQINFIIEQYQLGISSEDIAKQLNIASSTVLRNLVKNNITIRSNSESKRTYKINQNFFENIDNEIKAYYLGFLISDGCVGSNDNSIVLSQIKEDDDSLRLISNYIYGFTKIEYYKDYKGTDRSYLTVYSKKWKEDLIKLGCVPNKTFLTKFPDIDEEFHSHFIRGLIDGDGSVLNYDSPTITITGTDELLYKIEEIIYKLFNINGYIGKAIKYRENEKNISFLDYNGFFKCKIVGDWIYHNSTIKMNRKYQSYLQILDKNVKYESVHFSYTEEQKIINKFLDGQSINEISNNTNEYYSSIKKIIERNIPENHGSIDIITYKDIPLTKSFIKFCSLEEKQNIKSYLLDYFKHFGFPFPKYSNYEMLEDFKQLKSFNASNLLMDNKINTDSNLGAKIFRNFSPHFYELSSNNKKSMLDVFNSNLSEVLDNRLGISYKETFNISGAMIRQGLKNSKLAFSGSIFRSTIAKLIYDNYCVNDDIVYDYSCGFGQRFLGAMASKHNLKYIGAEPWTKSFESLNKMARFLNYQHKTEIYNVGSENFIEDKYINQISLAFSSPPYFDTEIYCNESTQCNLNDFQYYLHYWNKTCENIYLLLKKDGKFIINISDLYKDDLLQIALEHKFTLIDTLHLKYRSFSKEKLEPVLVLQK